LSEFDGRQPADIAPMNCCDCRIDLIYNMGWL
jgi:hypothetical protein